MKLGGALAMASFLSTAAWCRRSASAFLPTATPRGSSSARRVATVNQLLGSNSGRSAVPTLQSNAVVQSSPAASASRLFSTAVAKEPAAVEEEEELPPDAWLRKRGQTKHIFSKVAVCKMRASVRCIFNDNPYARTVSSRIRNEHN